MLQRLAGPDGVVGVLDVNLVAKGIGGGQLPARSDLEDHLRVRHTAALRQRVRGDHRGLVTLARGLAGRLELSVQTFADQQRGPGNGKALIGEARTWHRPASRCSPR